MVPARQAQLSTSGSKPGAVMLWVALLLLPGCSVFTSPGAGPLADLFDGTITVCLPLEPQFGSIAFTAATLTERGFLVSRGEVVPGVRLIDAEVTTVGAEVRLVGLERNTLVPPAVFGVPLPHGAEEPYLEGQGTQVDEPSPEVSGDATLVLIVRPEGDVRFRHVNIGEVEYKIGPLKYRAPTNIDLFFVESTLEEWDFDCGPVHQSLVDP